MNLNLNLVTKNGTEIPRTKNGTGGDEIVNRFDSIDPRGARAILTLLYVSQHEPILWNKAPFFDLEFESK